MLANSLRVVSAKRGNPPLSDLRNLISLSRKISQPLLSRAKADKNYFQPYSLFFEYSYNTFCHIYNALNILMIHFVIFIILSKLPTLLHLSSYIHNTFYQTFNTFNIVISDIYNGFYH